MSRPKKALTEKQSSKQIKDEMLVAVAEEKSERMTKIVKKTKVFTPLEDIQKNGKSYRGKKEIIKMLTGGRLSAQECINAKCYDCMGWYLDDGATDCNDTACPLHSKMPYNKGKVKSRIVNPTTVAKRMKTIKEKKE